MRSRTKPESVGISSVGQRRVPGLRREEVAQLAGMGVAWYTWLEQGRDVNVSSDVLERLYTALALLPAEREHLFSLAHNRPPPNTRFKGSGVSVASAALIGRMADAAFIANTLWDVLAWNGAAARIFPNFESAEDRRPNMLRFLFTSQPLRAVFDNWEGFARGNLEKFRIEFWRNRNERPFADLVSELLIASPEFRLWWNSPAVHPIENGLETFRSNYGPAIDYRVSVLIPMENESQRLIVFVPPKEADPKHGVNYAKPNGDASV